MESEERYQLIVQNLDDIIYITETLDDPFRGQLSFVNDKIEDILGYDPSEFLNNHDLWFRLLHPDDIPSVIASTEKIIRDKRSVTRYYRLRHKETGDYLYLEDKVVPTVNGNRVISFMGVARDITERKRVEEAYLQRDEELKAIIESSTDGILVVDHLGQVIHTNRKFAEMWSIPDELILTKSDEKMLEHVMDQLEDPQAFITKILKLYESAESGFDVLFFKDGKVFERYSNPLILKGAVSGRVWAFRDISERVRSEEALITAKQEIEVWNRELEKRVRDKTDELSKSQTRLLQAEKLSVMGQLAACLAHELNSPLAGLLPLLDKYRKKAEEGSEMYREMTLMHNAGEYMARIVKNFGSFSRAGSSGIDDLCLNEIIEDTLGISAGRIDRSGIKVIREYTEGLPRIKADRTGLQQVVLNMISNAGDAMPGGGTFVIRTGFNKERNLVEMEFSDEGEGIREEILGRIFDPFFTTKKHGEGVGLGLAVTYGIIKNHNGEISVESTYGKGTKFAVLLPVNNI